MGRHAARLTALAAASAVVLGLAPSAAATPSTAAPAPAAAPAAAPLAQGPVYPSAPVPSPTAELPSPQPIDATDWRPGDKIVADGRVIPHVSRVTESIDFAVLYPVLPNADLDVLLKTARDLPLGSRKIMLTVDVADEGATAEDMQEDAEATARAMVQEQRTGLADGTVDSGQPHLKAGWVMATVMLPPASASGSGLPDDGSLQPVVDLALGRGVTADEDAVATLEEALAGHGNDEELTDGLDDLVRALTEVTEVEAGISRPGQLGKDPGLKHWQDDERHLALDLLRGLGILPVIVLIGLAALGLQTFLWARRTRGAAQGRGAFGDPKRGRRGHEDAPDWTPPPGAKHAAPPATLAGGNGGPGGAAVVGKEGDPSWYRSHADDPSLGLRHRLWLLGLALSAEGAHDLPSGRKAVTAMVEHTHAVEARTGGLRESLRPGRAARQQSRAEDLQTRAEQTAQLIGDLVREGHKAHPPVRFDPEVEDAAWQYAGVQQKGNPARNWIRRASRRST